MRRTKGFRGSWWVFWKMKIIPPPPDIAGDPHLIIVLTAEPERNEEGFPILFNAERSTTKRTASETRGLFWLENENVRIL